MVDTAERGGIDGVFVSDHLWPMGTTSGATLSAFPLLAAVAARTQSMHVGTLVARVGLGDLTKQFATLQQIAGDRLIAGLGIGDKISKPENEAYGVGWQPRDVRLALLEDQIVALGQRNITTWVGGTSDAIRAVAAKHDVAINAWSPSILDSGRVLGTESRMLGGDAGEMTWGGVVEMDVRVIVEALEAVASAGASWAVVLISGSGQDPLRAAETLVEAKALLAP